MVIRRRDRVLHARPGRILDVRREARRSRLFLLRVADRRQRQRNVVYYLHGGEETHRSWSRSREWDVLRRAWAQKNIEASVVVSISFGPYWLLAERNEAAASGLFEKFVNDVVPFVEDELLKGRVGRRHLVGFSMGGLNAAALAFKRPDLFPSAALISPAFWPMADLRRAAGTNASFVARMALQFYPDHDAFIADSPAALCARSLASPRLLLSAGERDPVFLRGVGEFAELARARGLDATVVTHPFGHAAVPAEALIEFLKR